MTVKIYAGMFFCSLTNHKQHLNGFRLAAKQPLSLLIGQEHIPE